MASVPGLLAVGPWEPSQVHVSWSSQPFEPAPSATAAADLALAELRRRGSPSHDGLAARMAAFATQGDGLTIALQPARWALRLTATTAADAMSVLCVVRDVDGRWLAGRRAAWLASWARRWALGAAGSVEVDENPVHTLVRELDEEWSVRPVRMRVEALVRLPSNVVMLVAQAWLGADASVTPDDEHEDYAWWPADVAQWPAEADEPLRRVAAMLTGP